MKTLGPTMEKYLVRVIFRIILVLYIIYIAIKLIAVILVENISGASALREESLEKLRQNLTGNITMDHVQNSKKI
jgi:type IV secretory pathway VirB2 component (pilin)